MNIISGFHAGEVSYANDMVRDDGAYVKMFCIRSDYFYVAELGDIAVLYVQKYRSDPPFILADIYLDEIREDWEDDQNKKNKFHQMSSISPLAKWIAESVNAHLGLPNLGTWR